MSSSTPSLNEFSPVIPYQRRVLEDIRHNFDYSKGVHELLLSGSVGSAKSILAAHAGVTHCVANPGARLMLGRRGLPDLKSTIFAKIVEHLQGSSLIEGQHYKINNSISAILFLFNNSLIMSRSWGDKKWRKFRSLELSAAIIEELTENTSEEFNAFYPEMLARVGRLPHIKEKWVINCTNPDAPSHSAYDYFIKGESETRRVYYSVTSDNPFLDKSYIQTLMRTYTAQEIRRMIYGEWLEIKSEVIYYAYNAEVSLIKSYRIRPDFPIFISFDFNIALGKPMSACMFQMVGKDFFFFCETVIHGARTEDSIDEMESKGYFNFPCRYVVTGDATGASGTPNSKQANYDIIEQRLANYVTPDGRKLVFDMEVPYSNPPLRTRHSLVNGLMCNSMKETHIFVHKDCVTIDKSFKLSKLKKGSSYVEDDSDYFQHVGTAATYGILVALDYHQGKNRYSNRRLF